MKAEKHIIGMLALIMSTSLLYQNCGSGFTSNVSSAVNSAASSQTAAPLPQVAVQIVNIESVLNQGEAIDFKVNGNIPVGAVIAWSNINNSSGLCSEQGASTGPNYKVICNSAGTINVTVAIIQQGQVVGSSSANFTINAVASTPTPTPTPTGSPTPTPNPLALQGQAIYSANCATCHNPIEISNVRYTSVAQLTAVISGNLGNMHNTAAMQALIMTDATDVANMNALIFALSN